MNDEQIVEMLFQRNELALKHTEEKYGRLCLGIASGIVGNRQDAEECVNDAYLRIWQSIPPERPRSLGAYLSRIVRNLALNFYGKQHASKRIAPELISELDECVNQSDSTAAESAEELGAVINEFLSSLDELPRKIFMRRYYFTEPINDICRRYGISRSRADSILYRAREKLRENLKRRGVSI